MSKRPILALALTLTLAACSPAQSPELPTSGTPTSAPATSQAADPTTDPSRDPATVPTTDAGVQTALPALTTIDGDPIEIPEPLDPTTFRVGTETEDYEISAVFSTGLAPGDGSVAEGSATLVGGTCDGDAIGAHPTASGIAFGPFVVGTDTPAGEAPPIAGRDIAWPEGIHEGGDSDFHATADGGVVWTRMNFGEYGDTTWSLLVAGPDESTARVVASSDMPEFEGRYLLSTWVQGDSVIMSSCTEETIPDCGALHAVSLAGGDLREIGNGDLAQALRGATGFLAGDEEGSFAEGTYPAGEWGLHALIGEDFTDTVVVLGEGPAAETFATYDAEISAGSATGFVLAGLDVENSSGWAIAHGDAGVTAVASPTQVQDVALTDNFALAIFEGVGVVVIPQDGSEPWILKLGPEGNRMEPEYIVDTSCGDVVAFSAWNHDMSDSVGMVVTLLP